MDKPSTAQHQTGPSQCDAWKIPSREPSTYDDLTDLEKGAVKSYLSQVPLDYLSYNLDVPLVDLIPRMQLYVVLFCENDNAGLLDKILKDAVSYAKFCNGLSPNFMEADDEFVVAVRAEHGALDARMADPLQRHQIRLAFRNTNFRADAGVAEELRPTGDRNMDGSGGDADAEMMD
ncbi:Uu.00g054950.m01.CDS01 [Anthostomella pinea]|uniref:Uu.00g054950.m01.CDS01 n=1 Tax=Anthostomella pinea TaxID=933095 RepID=A0AAI8VXM3_9PEZI|nr:Uu.00g054950.m01.CDS01 [Anthostomella pinea]